MAIADPKDTGNTADPKPGQEQTQTQPPPQQPPPAEEQTFPASHVHDLREENKTRRLNEKKLQEQLDAMQAEQAEQKKRFAKALGLEGAEGDDEELVKKAQEKAAASEQKAKNALAQAVILNLATQANFHNPERAYKLLDQTDIEVDLDTGDVKGAKEAVEKMAKDDPWLVKPAGDSAKPTSPNLTTGGGNPPADQAGGASHEEAMKKIMEEAKKFKDPIRASTFIFAEKRKLGIK